MTDTEYLKRIKDCNNNRKGEDKVFLEVLKKRGLTTDDAVYCLSQVTDLTCDDGSNKLTSI